MKKCDLLDMLDCSPVIAAIQENGWDEAIKSPAKIIFCLRANILTIKERIAAAHGLCKRV